MARVLLFGPLAELASWRERELDVATVAAVLQTLEHELGDAFAALVPRCRIWVNGQPAESDEVLRATDEVALLPPVSGG